jgi:DNA primase
MGLIPQETIDQVLGAFDIAEVVGRYLTLKPAGRSLKALCPFHDEKTPSFTVNPERQSFKCFGCGKGGNLIGFVMEHEGLTFPEAVRALAAERGIRVPETGRAGPGAGAAGEGRIEAISKTLAFAQGHFARSLESPEGTGARAYLARRGYDAQAIRRFGLGFAPPGWDRLLRAAAAAALPERVVEEAGLAIRRDDGTLYDRFRNRVTFPVCDLRGKVVTFGARALDPEDTPKYLNGPETPVFRKGNLLFAIDLAREGIRRSGEALLMEGYTDVLMSHLHGVDRAVGGMGTAFTPRQAALLKRFTPRVVLVYDGDEAGRTGAEKALEILLEAGLEVRVALLPEGRDVDEILVEEGREALERLVADALDLLRFKWSLLESRHDLTTPSGRARLAEAMAASIARVPSALERDQWFRLVSERLGGAETEAVVRAAAARSLPGWRGSVARPGTAAAEAPRPVAERVLEAGRRDLDALLLAAALDLPHLRPAIFRAVGPEDFSSPLMGRLYNALRDLDEAGSPCDHRTLAARVAEDPEAVAALAGLPEDPTLEDRVTSAILYLEGRRASRRQVEELRRRLADPSPAAAPSADPEPTE